MLKAAATNVCNSMLLSYAHTVDANRLRSCCRSKTTHDKFLPAHKEKTQIVKLATLSQQRRHTHTDFVETSDKGVCSYKLSCTLFIAPKSSYLKEQGHQRETSEIAIKVRFVSQKCLNSLDFGCKSDCLVPKGDKWLMASITERRIMHASCHQSTWQLNKIQSTLFMAHAEHCASNSISIYNHSKNLSCTTRYLNRAARPAT